MKRRNFLKALGLSSVGAPLIFKVADLVNKKVVPKIEESQAEVQTNEEVCARVVDESHFPSIRIDDQRIEMPSWTPTAQEVVDAINAQMSYGHAEIQVTDSTIIVQK